MAAPVFGSSGILAYGAARTSSAIPVPTGVASGDVIVVFLYQEDTTPTVTPPTGFTELTFTTTPVTTGQVSRQRVWWKRASAADTGTYAFTHTSGTTQGVALRYTGALASGTPIEVLGSATSGGATALTLPVTGTTGGADRAVLYGLTTYTATTFTAPSGFTARYSPAGTDLAAFDKAQATAGSTGSVSATAAVDGASTATLIGVLPVASSAFTGTAALTGGGTTVFAGTPAIAGTRNQSGAGSLVTTGSPRVTASVALAGAGALSFNAVVPPSGAIALTGAGQLDVAGLATFLPPGARRVFLTPYVQRRVPISPPLTALLNFSLAVLRIQGQWVETEYPSEEQIDAADIYFPGGYEHDVDADMALVLKAAGYEVNVIADPASTGAVGVAVVGLAVTG